MELKNGNKSSEQHLTPEANVSFSGGFQPFTGSKPNVETIHEDPEQVENSRISNDASSLTSDSTCHELIQVDSKFSPPHHGLVPMQKSREEKEIDVSNEALSQLEDYFGSSSSSTACISDVTHESVITSVLPTQRPSVQVMERTGGFDPNRIPASVFGNPTTVADWSLASNESLFSIQIGRGSFSRDQSVILDYSEEFSIPEGSYFSKEIDQSGEFVKFDKLYQSKEAKEPHKLQICRETIREENEEKCFNFDLDNARILEERIPYTHYRSINENSKIKTEGIGSGTTDHTLSKKKKSSKSSSCGSCCPSCDCCCTSSRCCSQRPDCSCKCFSCPTCSCSSWPSCSCKKCCSGCSSENLCCQDCCIKCPSSPSCCCKSSSSDCCKCRFPTWSLKKIFCCLSSQSSTKTSPRSRRPSNLSSKNWCSCFSCGACCSCC